jgi:hypothetical protein
VCGAPVDGDCGSGWPSMGTRTCDSAHQLHQTICGCHPPHYFDPLYWVSEGNNCYSHLTGDPC